MKIVFLDIDGVLNCSDDFKRIKHTDGLCLSPQKLNRLRRILRETGAKIVLSSTWRRHEDAMDFLNANGIHWIDKTPASFSGMRGREVSEWLNKHGSEVESYVILDDNDDFFDSQKPFFVKTEFIGKNSGLQDEHVEKAIKILNNKGPQINERQAMGN